MMNLLLIKRLPIIIAMALGNVLFAQTITGNVSDVNGPIPGVNILVKNTNQGSVTDFDGNYSIDNIQPGTVLVFSYVGYTTVEITVKDQSVINVVLTEDTVSLDEVVVVGYTAQKRESINGAISSVDMGDLSKSKVVDVSQALQGQVSGVFVAANTGAPGDGIKLRIRGEGTIGKNDVLYVIDGVPTRDITFLNQADIKSISVLKDAAAGAIYGSRSSAGVVVITTKNGKKGKPLVDVEINSGAYFVTNLPKLLNTKQYLSTLDQAWHNTQGNDASAVSPYAFDAENRTDLADTNWLNELFTTGISKNAQVSFSGATDNFNYLLSGGYYGIDGIVVENNDQFQRFNFRLNLNTNLTDRFKIGTNVQLSHLKQDKLSSSGDTPGIIRHALLRPPVIPVYKNPTDPTYTTNNPYTDLPFYTGPDNGWSEIYEYTSNPIAIVNFTDDVRKTFQLFGNVFGEWAVLPDNTLKFKSNLGVDIKYNHNKSFASNYGDNNINDTSNPYYGMGRINRPNGLDENRGEEQNFTFTNTLNYIKTLNEEHDINALLGMEYISSRQSAVGGSRQNYDIYTDPFRYLDFGSTQNIWSSGSAVNWALLSYFASGSYAYQNKYFASATMRADASSRFGANNKWGYFPSFSAGWVLSKEPFLNQKDWLSNLKLRASWGQGGNQEIANNAYETLVTTTGGIINIVRYGNPDLKWETTTQTNIGVDLAFLKNKLSFSVDYFNKRTTDMLLTVGLPAVSVGVIDRTYVNAGEVLNKGFEFFLKYQNYDREFKYNINSNLSTLKNNVEKLYTYVKNITDNATHTITVVNQPISSYYGYKFDGIYQNTTEINAHLFSNTNNVQPGDIKFKDLNNDGQINADDRTYIGNSIPKITYGINFNSEYKNFDFSFMLQGVSDVDRYNDLKQILNYDSRPFNSTTAVLKSWSGEGTSNTTPRLTFNNNGGANVSDVFVEDASYLRLKNIELGYTLRNSILGLNNLRIYLSGQNLFTISDYTGLDPESTSLIDMGTYPQSSAFILGIKAKL